MSEFVEKYIDQMVDATMFHFDETKRPMVRSKIREVTEKRITDIQCDIINNYTVTSHTSTLVKVIDRLLAKTVIVTGEGALFRPEETLASKALLSVMKLRKFAKNKALKFKEQGNMTAYRKWNVIQNVYKLLANAYYGLLGARSSMIYNKFLAAAVTSTARTFITSVILGFEDLTGNLLFYDIDDIIKYVVGVLRNKSDFTKIVPEYMVITKDMVIDKFKKTCKTLSTNLLHDITDLINNISDYNDLLNIWFKNNLYGVIALPSITQKLSDLFKYDYTNIFLYMDNSLEQLKKMKDTTQEDFDKHVAIYDFMKVVKEYVYVNEYHSNRIKKLDDLKRENILLTDTDSVFLYLNKFNRFCKNLLSKFNTYNEMNALNLFIFIGTRLSEIVISKLAIDRLNIPTHLAPEIALKNEFIFSRLIMTNNKRQYVAKPKFQEGRRLKDDVDIEIKGLTLKKSQIHKKVRMFYKEFLETELLKEIPDFKRIFRLLFEFRDSMRDEIIRNRSTEYCATLKLNSLNAYKNPERMPVVRGAAIWNKLFPGEPIQTGEKCGAYKLKGLTKFKDLDKIKDLVARKAVMEAIFDDTALAAKGATIICFPKSNDTFPEWLAPFIDVDSIVNDNMSHIIILLESFRFKAITERGKRYISNIVEV